MSSQAPVLSPELTRQSVALARALSAATRIWALSLPEHPAVAASVRRLARKARALNEALTSGDRLSKGIIREHDRSR